MASETEPFVAGDVAATRSAPRGPFLGGPGGTGPVTGTPAGPVCGFDDDGESSGTLAGSVLGGPGFEAEPVLCSYVRQRRDIPAQPPPAGRSGAGCCLALPGAAGEARSGSSTFRFRPRRTIAPAGQSYVWGLDVTTRIGT